MKSSSKIEVKKFNGKIFDLWELQIYEIDKHWVAMDLGSSLAIMLVEDWIMLDREKKNAISLFLID